MKEKKGNSKKFLFIIIGICLVLTIILGLSIYFFINKKPKVVEEKLTGGEIVLTYADDSNMFSINNVSPMTNEVGIKLDKADQYFDFTVNANFDSAQEIDYEIYIEKVETQSTIKDEDIRIYLEKQKSGTYEKVLDPKKFVASKKKSGLGAPKESMVIYNDSTTSDISENYRLRMWLSDKALTNGTNNSYTIKINVVGKAK